MERLLHEAGPVAGVGGGLATDRHLGRVNVFFDDSIFGRVFVFSGRARGSFGDCVRVQRPSTIRRKIQKWSHQKFSHFPSGLSDA